MTSTPPRGAVWLIELFVPSPNAEPVFGDLAEEFAAQTGLSGHAAARRWYWRQAVSTILHLARASIQAAPWSAAALVYGSLVAAGVADLAIRKSVELVLTNVNAYDYVSAVWFWRTHDAIRYVAVPVALGWSIAATARGREMAIVTLVAAALIAGFVWNVTLIAQRGIFLGVVWRTPLVYHAVQMGTTFPLCILAGGMIGRVQQMRAARIAA